jgi:hypothetical protein
MYKIIGTAKIKGSLNLPQAGGQISAGDSMLITPDQRQSHEIQDAYRGGYIEFVMMDGIADGPSDCFVCINKHTRPITIPNRKGEVMPGREFTLTKAEFYTTAIQQARTNGMIQVVEQTGKRVTELNDGVVDAGKYLKGKKSAKATEASETVETPPKRESSSKRNEHGEPVLDINEELSNLQISKKTKPTRKTATKKVESRPAESSPADPKPKAPKPQMKIDAMKVTPVPPKPKQTRMPKTRYRQKEHMKTHFIDDENPAPVDPHEGDPRSCTVAWSPGKRNPGIVDLRNMVDDEDDGEDGPIQVGHQGTELEFVDKLQEQERIAADPRLRINQGDEDSDDEE